MVIDKKGRLFGRISIIDIIIVLAVIAVIAAAVSRLAGPDSVSSQDTILIQFYQDEAPAYAAEAVKIGDPVTDFQLGSDFGKVVDVKVGESEGFAESADGRFVMSPKKGYASIYITAEGKGVYTDTGVVVSGSNYYLGRTVTLRAGKSVFYARVYSIEKKG